MGELIGHNQQLGILDAKVNWVKCGDLNGTSKTYKHLNFDINAFSKRSKTLLDNLGLILDDDELNALKKECEETRENTMLLHEEFIEKNHRPSNLNYNEKALIIMTDKAIPDDIKIGLSFGWKFLFPFVTKDNNIHQVLAELEMCIEDSIPIGSQYEAFSTTARILNNRNDYQNDDTIQWLCFLALRTDRFFKKNVDIFATRSDKGGHTVIIDVDKYDNALRDMLSDQNSYEILNENPINELIEKETKIMKFFRSNWRTRELSTTNERFEPRTKVLAKFYGLPKVHKEVFCLRPITAMNAAPGYNTGRIINQILNEIFPRSHFHVKDSYDMKDFCDTAIILEHDVLVSFDAVSMYTSIPRELVKRIILEHHAEIFNKYGIAIRVFENIFDFYMSECTVFTALDTIYRQKEGLPMGGSASTTLARIVMDKVVAHLYNRVDEISFIKVFVDDTMAAMKRENIDTALQALNDFCPTMKFTKEVENEQQSINFLNLTLLRDENFISTNWYRKIYASGRLLNYFSSHKRTTVMGTASAFIETVLKLSDPEFFTVNRSIVEQTLRDNSFPETVIMSLLNKEYTFMPRMGDKRTNKRNNKRAIYKIYPQAICKSREIKKNLLRWKEKDIIYAESTRNTKINFVRTRKTSTPKLDRANTILTSKCVCGRKYKITATKFNETGRMAANSRVLTQYTGCTADTHAFRKVKVAKGLSYNRQTSYLVKYIKWKYRGKVINTEFSLPNYHFAKILSKVD